MHRLDIIINRHGSPLNSQALYIYKLLRVNTTCDPLIWFKFDNWKDGKNEIYWKEEYEGYFDSPYEHIVAPRTSLIKENQNLKYTDIHGKLELTTSSMADKSFRLTNCTESKRKAGLILKNPQDRKIRICTTIPEINIPIEINPLPHLLLIWGTKTFSEETEGPDFITDPACKLLLPETPWDPEGSKEPPSVTFSMEKSEFERSIICFPISSGEAIKNIVIRPPGEDVSDV